MLRCTNMSQLMRSKKAISNTIFVGSVVALAVVCAIVGFVGYSTINNLQTENNSFKSQTISLQRSINDLQSSNNQLQSSYNQLQTNYQNLQSSYNQLQLSYDELNSSYSQLLGPPSVTITSVSFNSGSPNSIGIVLKNTGTKTATVATVKVNNVASETSQIIAPSSITILPGNVGTMTLNYAWDNGNVYKIDLFDNNNQIIGSTQQNAPGA